MDGVKNFKLEVSRLYKITDKDGTQITLDEADMKALLAKQEIRELVPAAWTSGSNNGSVSLKTGSNVSVAEVSIEPRKLHRKVRIPAGFQKYYEKGCDPRAPFQTTFTYFKNDNGEFGYYTYNDDNGRLTTFSRLGRIDDAESSIGSFVRAFIKKYPRSTDSPPIKTDLYGIGTVGATDGRKVKAILDVLEAEGYVRIRANPEKQNRPGYVRTEKLDRLEELVKHEQEVHTPPLATSQ